MDSVSRMSRNADEGFTVYEELYHRGVSLVFLKERHIDTLVALTAANDEAQRFYKSIPNSQMHDVGIWIDIM